MAIAFARQMRTQKAPHPTRNRVTQGEKVRKNIFEKEFITKE